MSSLRIGCPGLSQTARENEPFADLERPILGQEPTAVFKVGFAHLVEDVGMLCETFDHQPTAPLEQQTPTGLAKSGIRQAVMEGGARLDTVIVDCGLYGWRVHHRKQR